MESSAFPCLQFSKLFDSLNLFPDLYVTLQTMHAVDSALRQLFYMARYMAHSDAINFTLDQLNFRSINAQIESELKAKSANRQENRRMQIEIVALEE